MAPLLTGPPAKWIDRRPLAVGPGVSYDNGPIVCPARSKQQSLLPDAP